MGRDMRSRGAATRSLSRSPQGTYRVTWRGVTNNRSGSGLRFEVEELGCVGRYIQVKSVVLEIFTVAGVELRTEQVAHSPIMLVEAIDLERDITLTPVRCQIDYDQVEGRRVGLPLDQQEVVVGNIVRPGLTGGEQGGLAAAHSRDAECTKQMLVEGCDFGIGLLDWPPREMDRDGDPGSGKLSFVEEG